MLIAKNIYSQSIVFLYNKFSTIKFNPSFSEELIETLSSEYSVFYHFSHYIFYHVKGNEVSETYRILCTQQPLSFSSSRDKNLEFKNFKHNIKRADSPAIFCPSFLYHRHSCITKTCCNTFIYNKHRLSSICPKISGQ